MTGSANTHVHRPRALGLGLATVGACVVLGACGSSSSKSSTTGASGSMLAFAECMRAHGLPHFPDPLPSGSSAPQGADMVFGFAVGPGTGVNTQSPAYQSAIQSCQKLLTGGRPRPGVPVTLKTQLLAHAQCMRDHGVPNFPDPKFPASGGIATFDPPGVNLQSPAYRKAVQACGQ